MKPETQPDASTDEAKRAQALAETLDCLTEEDLCALYDIKPTTAENWRKRGKGPTYILAGNRYLYPKSSVAADLQSRTRKRPEASAKEAL